MTLDDELAAARIVVELASQKNDQEFVHFVMECERNQPFLATLNFWIDWLWKESNLRILRCVSPSVDWLDVLVRIIECVEDSEGTSDQGSWGLYGVTKDQEHLIEIAKAKRAASDAQRKALKSHA